MKAKLILENNMEFEGSAFGYPENTEGEIVFTTGMTGYEGTLTDPSFAGQIVVMTYPLIGNCGTNPEDMETDAPKLRGLIVREKCEAPNNWRCETDLDSFLKLYKIPGLEGIDTRKLTKIIRDEGIMKARLVTDPGGDTPDFTEQDRHLAGAVTCGEPYTLTAPGSIYRVAVIDLGVQKSVLRELRDMGCTLDVFPSFAPAAQVLSGNPDAVFLSSGPGNPKDIPEILENISLLCGNKPVFGVGLGHQLIGLAEGCDTEKMKFGHHGANHPVKDLRTGHVYITSQNHNYTVSRLGGDMEATLVNVNDGTVEGMRHISKPIAGVQFYPDEMPGPAGFNALFSNFLSAAKLDRSMESRHA